MDPVQRPLALTLGDPSGIGPDITLLAYEARLTEAVPFFVLLGDPDVLAERASMLGLSVKIEPVGEPAEAARCFDAALPVLPIAVPERTVAPRLPCCGPSNWPWS
jgi:4-hydroxythreonine-4-phosphate dehydrogenase